MLAKHHSWYTAPLQLALVFLSLTLAWGLRFEFSLPNYSLLLWSFPILALFRLAGMARFNLLHGYWRYTCLSDLKDIVKAVCVGTIAFAAAERWMLGIKSFPLSIYFLEAMLTGLMLSAVRIWSRLAERKLETRLPKSQKKRVMIVGAGSACLTLLDELLRHDYVVVGLVDDDPHKLRARMHGVPVIGTVDQLPALIKREPVHEVLIAIPSATGKQMRRIIEYCQQARVRFRTIPALSDLIENKVSVEQLRKVKLEDLLGRDPVKLSSALVHEQVTGRVVLVTGAAGSIGSELCVQLLHHLPARLVCVDQDESGLFFLEQKLRHLAEGKRAEFHVADVADRQRMRNILRSRRVEILFHAAAYKHVPMMESNVQEAVRNNVFGLLTLLDAAERSGCMSFLLISSDKAVNPTNVMGCTKRICELIPASRPNGRMRRVSVRFGNVLGSQGSVVPVFEEQIRKQRRVTITHPEITRFFMTIPEAASLVLQAFAVGKHGDILVLDMGEPVRIADLARTMIRLLARSEDDVEIVYTGLRDGEKLYEELFYASESHLPTQCDKVLHAHGSPVRWSVLQHHLQELRELIYDGADNAVRAKLQEIVPEYQFADAPALSVEKKKPSAAEQLPEWSQVDPSVKVWQDAASQLPIWRESRG